MRKILLILLSLMLLMPAMGLGEGLYCAVYTPDEEDPVTDLQIQISDGQIKAAFSLLPDWVFVMDAPGAVLPLMNQVPSAESSADFLPVLNSWMKLTGFTEEKGLFTGDLVDYATTKKTAVLSWSDLLLLLDVWEKNAETMSAETKAETVQFIRGRLLELAGQAPEISFRVDVFEAERALALTVFRREDTLCTLSLRMDSASGLRAVLGTAESGKTYYRTLDADFGTAAVTLILRSFADDRGYGYRQLTDSARLSEEKFEIRDLGSGKISLESSYALGGDGIVSGGFSGEILRDEEGHMTLDFRCLEGKNQDTEKFRILVTDDADRQKEISGNAKVFDLMTPDASLAAELGENLNLLNGQLTDLVIRLVPLDLLMLFM